MLSTLKYWFIVVCCGVVVVPSTSFIGMFLFGWCAGGMHTGKVGVGGQCCSCGRRRGGVVGKGQHLEQEKRGSSFLVFSFLVVIVIVVTNAVRSRLQLFCLLCYLCFGCFMQLPCTQELRRGVIIVFVISSGIIVQFQAKVIIDEVGH